MGGAEITLSEEKQKNLADRNAKPQKVTVGVRPEHITLSEDGSESLSGTVEVSEMMGSSVHLHLNSLGQNVIVIAQTVDIDEGHKSGFSIGDKVSYTFSGDLIHMFSKEDDHNLEF